MTRQLLIPLHKLWEGDSVTLFAPALAQPDNAVHALRAADCLIGEFDGVVHDALREDLEHLTVAVSSVSCADSHTTAGIILDQLRRETTGEPAENVAGLIVAQFLLQSVVAARLKN